MTEKLALWFLLDSKVRAALKKAERAEEAMNNAAERSKHQQSRPQGVRAQ